MADSSKASSRNSLTTRKPFERISHTWEIPAALWECKQLALEGKQDLLLSLLDSIIIVSGADPHTWVDLPRQATAQAGR